MRYLGGKNRLAKHIGQQIAGLMKEYRITHYAEPFVGSAAVAEWLAKHSKISPWDMFLSDAHEDLILMYKALANGWSPPSEVTEEMYNRLRDEPPSALRGFVGFGASWGGKFFGGYARGEDRNYAAESRRALLATNSELWSARWIWAEYDKVAWPIETLVYCDPPYANTTGYTAGFDSDRFWRWAADMSQRQVVVVSEYTAPEGWVTVWTKGHHTSVRAPRGSEQRLERLFMWNELL